MKKFDISLRQGSTFKLPVMWEQSKLVYKSITAISKSSPVRLTATAHGVPDGWMCAVMNVAGMTELNAQNNPPKDSEFRAATVVDANTVEFNGVNAAGFRTYVSGGQLVYYAPVDLTDYTARMEIKDKVGGTALLTLTSANGGISIDAAAKKITVTVTPEQTAGVTWTKGVYDLEMVGPTGIVTKIIEGAVALTKEVTTIS